MKNYCIIHILLFILLILIYQCSHAQSTEVTENAERGNTNVSCKNSCDAGDPTGHKISPAKNTLVKRNSIRDNLGRTIANYIDRTSDRVRKTWRQAMTELDFTDEVNSGLKRCAEKITSLMH